MSTLDCNARVYPFWDFAKDLGIESESESEFSGILFNIA